MVLGVFFFGFCSALGIGLLCVLRLTTHNLLLRARRSSFGLKGILKDKLSEERFYFHQPVLLRLQNVAHNLNYLIAPFL